MITMTELVLVCEDLFGLEVASVIENIKRLYMERKKEPFYIVKGYISDNADPFGALPCSVKRLGSISETVPNDKEKYVLAIRDPRSKKEAVELLKARGASFETVIAPWTRMPDLEIGEGSVIAAFSIKDGIEIGKYTTIIGSMLSNHRIDDYSTVMRFSNIAGNDVGKNTYIGDHVFLAVGKSIGDNCYIADGSIVVKNVKPGMSVSGVPARKIKQRKE